MLFPIVQDQPAIFKRPFNTICEGNKSIINSSINNWNHFQTTFYSCNFLNILPNHHSIETFIEATRNEIREKIEKKRPSKYSNLTAKERNALQEQQSRNHIVITDADKWGAVVILDIEGYVKEAERQLNNKENYRKVNYYPTTANNETIHKVISRFQKENLLSKNICEGLKTENSKTPYFCLKPKVHKEGNPERPTISSISCHTSKISEYVDYQFQPIVKEIPSYVQDKTEFLRKINQIDFVPDNSYLVSTHYTPIFQMEKESNPSKRPSKNILNELRTKSNYYIHSVNTNTKQLFSIAKTTYR